jgi:hypothetical protein
MGRGSPKTLTDLLTNAEFLRRVLDGYQGPYSIGVTRAPNTQEGYAFLLQIQGPTPRRRLRYIEFQDQTIPVFVKGGLRVPVPF